MNITHRTAARVLLVDPTGRILLLLGGDPANLADPYWFTPGGGLEAGETSAQAAVREVAEETGLILTESELGEPLYAETIEFPWDGGMIRQAQQMYYVPVASFTPSQRGFDEIEQRCLLDHRWWSLAELAATTERYYPLDLIERLSACQRSAAC